MKMIVRCADYGMTDSITDGALKAIRDGILTDVGLMTNSNAGLRAALLIKPFQHVSIGQDLNLVSGTPATDPSLIPTLVGEDGQFISSVERKKRQLFNVSYEDAYLEMDNQIKRFIFLIGRKPCYLTGHSFNTPATDAATNDLRKKYNITADCFFMPDLFLGKRWYYQGMDIKPGDRKPEYSLEMQGKTDVEEFVLSGKCEFEGHDFTFLATHCGYCDGELMKMSTFSVIRGKELEMLCSPKIRKWISEQKIELINFDEYLSLHEKN